MKKWEKIHKNNKGLTLLELIISVAIISIVIGTATSFLVTGMNMYKNSRKEIRLQETVQLTLNSIENRIIDAQKGVRCDEGTDQTVLTIFNNDSREYIVWKTGDMTLCYAQSDDPTVGITDFTNAEILAENVEEFKVVQREGSGSGEADRIEISIKMFEDKRELTSNKVVTFRNDLMVNASEDKVYLGGSLGDLSQVDGISITPNDPVALPGTTCRLNGRVTGKGHPSQMISWDIDETSKNAGVTISNGLVAIPENIPGSLGTVTVTAKALADENVATTKTIKIAQITGLSVIAPDDVYAGTFMKLTAEVTGTNLSDGMKKVKFTVADGQQGVSVYSQNGIYKLSESVKGQTIRLVVYAAANEAYRKEVAINVKDTSISQITAQSISVNRGESGELITSIVSENLAESELDISWEIVDDAGLGNKVRITDQKEGIIWVDKDVNYEKAYTVMVKATVSAKRLSASEENSVTVAVSIPKVSISFKNTEAVITPKGSITIPYEVKGLKADPSDIYVATNPSIRNCIIYATKDGVQLSIGDNVKSDSFEVVATLKQTNASDSMTVSVQK